MLKHRHPRWLIAIIIPSLWLSACESPEEKEARHYERGVELYEAGEDQKAMVEFRNVLQLNPKNADAIFHMGLIHEREGRLQPAFAAFEQATLERPRFVAANVKLGKVALMANDLDKAARAADAIEKAEPRNPDGLVIKGAIALRRGDPQKALGLARRVLEMKPQYESAVMVLVGVYHELGEARRAIARLDEAIAANPQSLSLRLLKITYLEQASDIDTDALIATYSELIALQPEESAYPLALAEFYRRGHDPDRGTAVLRAAIDRGLKKPEVVNGLISLISQEKGLEAAVTELESLIERDPNNHQLRFLLADLYASGQRPEDAETTLDAIVAEVGEGPVADDARAAMARVRFASGDREGARTLAERVLTNDEAHRDANLVLGMILLEDGKFDDVLRSARNALREDGNWLPGLRLLAETHLQAGRTSLAVETLRKIVSLDPNDVRSAEVLARLLTDQGDYEAALKIWDDVVRLSDEPYDALRARADIEIRRGHFSAAQSDIEHMLKSPGQEVTGALLAGKVALARGRRDKAREWFAKAQALDPSAADPTIAIVRSYLADSDLDGALTYLQERTRAVPDDAVAFSLMGQILLRQDRSAEAESAFRQAITLHPPWPTPYQELVEILAAAGNFDGVVETYQSALTQWPDDPDVLMALATGYRIAGRFDEAIDTYARVVELHPEIELAANNYAALVADHQYRDPDRLKRALELADRFRASDDPRFLDTLGWVQYRIGDFAAAASYLGRAAALAGDYPQIRYHLGMALYRSGQKEQAVRELAKAVAKGVEYPGLDEAQAVYERLRAETREAANGATESGGT